MNLNSSFRGFYCIYNIYNLIKCGNLINKFSWIADIKKLFNITNYLLDILTKIYYAKEYRKWELQVMGATTLHTQFCCENGGGAMELLIIQLIWLLIFGLVTVTVIAVALIIILVIILSK